MCQDHECMCYDGEAYERIATLERENSDLLAALKDCEARLALLVHSGRSKMLDVRAAEKARAAIAGHE